MIWKFFTLKVIDVDGITHKANWAERFAWLCKGCPLREEKVVNRYCQMIKNHR